MTASALELLQKEVESRRSRLLAIKNLLKNEGLTLETKESLRREEKEVKKKWWAASEKLKRLRAERKLAQACR